MAVACKSYLEAKGKDKQVIDKVRAEINDFVCWIFQHHTQPKIRGGKVIHDTIWGTNRYEAFETALINTPLLQRLRNIHQTSYTYFTYPSSRHTRFEHTLGVANQIDKLISALVSKFAQQGNNFKQNLLDDGVRRTLRVAALLHDCAHGPMSHTSEEIYGHFPEIKILKKYTPFISASPHEVLAALILKSEHFKEFFDRLSGEYPYAIDYELMVNSIVGYTGDPNYEYKMEMLHGPFDADKLDYLFRDGHFSGLPLHVDLDRLWYSLDVNFVDGRRRLTIDWGGTSSLEQIIFSKMSLYPAVYHHHKVRASDCMFKGIIEYISNKGIKHKKLIPAGDSTPAFTRAAHFLYFNDSDIFNLNKLDDPDLHTLIHDLQYRRLLKRAVVIAVDTLVDSSKIDDFCKSLEIGPGYYRDIAKAIWEKAGRPGMLEQIWVDCPKDPDFTSTHDTWISPLGADQSAYRLTEFFRFDQYAKQYKDKKWRAHVFCPDQYIDVISKASVEIFREWMGIEFKPLAFHLCHVNVPVL